MQNFIINMSDSKLLTYSAGKLNLGQKWDNSVAKITFSVKDEYILDHSYVVLESPSNVVTAIPLQSDLSFIISNGVTKEAGEWKLVYLSCKTIIDEKGNIPNNEEVVVSSIIKGYISDNYLTESITGVIDANFTVIYDSLLALKAELETEIKNIGDTTTLINNFKTDMSNLLDEKLTNIFLKFSDLQTQLTTVINLDNAIKTQTDNIKTVTDTISDNTSIIITGINDINDIVLTIKTNLIEVKNDTTILKSNNILIKNSIDALDIDTNIIKANTIDIKTDTGAIKSDITLLKADTAILKSDTGILKTDATTIKTDTNTIKSDTSAIKTDTGNIITNITNISNLMGSISTVLDKLNGETV